jgi:hypothetical protein
MEWILLILAALVVLVALAALTGAMLPMQHHGTRKAHYRVSPEALYAVLAGPPDWRTGVKSFSTLPDDNGRKRWWEQDSHGQKVTFEVMEDTPPRRLAVRIADGGLPFGGTWTFDIARVDGGSELRISEDGEIYNVIFRFMARFIFGYYGSIETYLRDLGAKFSQPITIEA